MGEIDTKSIESVQTALSLFGEKGYQKKYRTNSSDGESDRDEIQALQQELANYKVRLEAKGSAHKQVLLKLQQCEERIEELTTMLVKSELERDHSFEECRNVEYHVSELDSKVKEMADQVLETAQIREQLSDILNELEATRSELLVRETELAAAREMEKNALTRAKMMENSLTVERQKAEELVKNAEELGETILVLKAAALEAEMETGRLLSSKDAEIDHAKEAVVQAEEQLEDMKEQVKLINEMENQLQAKSVFIESLQRELHEANDLLSLSEKASSDAVANAEALKAELEIKERYVSDRIIYTKVIEMELSRLKLELSNQNENISHLNGDLEVLTSNLEETKAELAELKERENDAEVEMALLKSELHQARSRIAAAEAAEMRGNSVKSGLYLAVQQLAVEAEEAKKEENLRLRHGVDKIKDEAEPEAEADFTFSVDSQIKTSSLDKELPENNEANATAAPEEYGSLVRDDETADQMSTMEDSDQCPQSKTKQEVESLKKELEAAMAKIGEFRTRAEQAMSRAESAEKAKSALEDQLKIWQERKQRRKAALAALREESAPRKFNPPSTTDKSISTHPPLFKVLNMKF